METHTVLVAEEMRIRQDSAEFAAEHPRQNSVSRSKIVASLGGQI
jgi:hypothetical protein